MYEYWINKQLVILWTEKDFSTELLSIRQFGKLTKQSNKNVIVRYKSNCLQEKFKHFLTSVLCSKFNISLPS